MSDTKSSFVLEDIAPLATYQDLQFLLVRLGRIENADFLVRVHEDFFTFMESYLAKIPANVKTPFVLTETDALGTPIFLPGALQGRIVYLQTAALGEFVEKRIGWYIFRVALEDARGYVEQRSRLRFD